MTKKTILVTGASSGIGKATALALIEEGHVVYGAARRVGEMRELVERGGRALSLDVTDHVRVSEAVDEIIRANGRIDVLVNNAGYAIYGAVEDTTIEDARRQFEVNLFGLAALTKAVLPHMRAQGAGKIINVSSVGGKIYTPLGAWYHATKHALEGWSDCLRLETEPFGIDVVIVEPGIILTEFGAVMNPPLLERSGSGAYAKMARAVAGASEASYKGKQGSPPSVIADVIVKAVAARRPKTRYVAGQLARPLLSMRRWLSDRAFDRLVMREVKQRQSP
jgi:NAD(P)-dependent dehydrogenase (short-subunit alcohol dehydrogenase family)